LLIQSSSLIKLNGRTNDSKTLIDPEFYSELIKGKLQPKDEPAGKVRLFAMVDV